MSSQMNLQQAIALVKAGNKTEARPILLDLLWQESDNDTAWLWLAACFEKPGEKKYCMEQALRINPANDSVRQTIQKIVEPAIPIVMPSMPIEGPPLELLMDTSATPLPPVTAIQPAAPRPRGPASDGWWHKLPPDLTISVSGTRPKLREFPELSHRAFQHPLDVQARAALEKIPLLPQISKKLSEAYMEKIIRIQEISSSLRVSARQYPSLYRQYLRIARILDIRKLPELYIETSPVINAHAMGQENYFIVITTGLIDHMTEDEMLGVIAHELGHVKCEHLLYSNVANILQIFGANLIEQLIPGFGGLASLGAQLALMEWYRKAEFSCDRAALLAVQEVEVVNNMLAKLGGYSKHILNDSFDMEEVKHQAEEYEEIGTGSMWEKTIKLYALLGQTHPYPVVRVAEISRWHDGPEYQKIMRGDYMRAGDEVPAGPPPILTPTALQCISCQTVCALDTFQCPACGGSMDLARVVCAKCANPVRPEWVACPTCRNNLKAKPGGVISNVREQAGKALKNLSGK